MFRVEDVGFWGSGIMVFRHLRPKSMSQAPCLTQPQDEIAEFVSKGRSGTGSEHAGLDHLHYFRLRRNGVGV